MYFFLALGVGNVGSLVGLWNEIGYHARRPCDGSPGNRNGLPNMRFSSTDLSYAYLSQL